MIVRILIAVLLVLYFPAEHVIAQTYLEPTAIAAQAAIEAAKESAAARANSTNLIIMQVFSLITVIVGFLYKIYERRQDIRAQAEKDAATESRRKAAEDGAARMAHEHSAAIQQVHVLVNSQFLAAKEGELRATRRDLASLLTIIEIAKKNGEEPDAATVQAAKDAHVAISALEAEVAQRRHQTLLADRGKAAAQAAIRQSQANFPARAD